MVRIGDDATITARDVRARCMANGGEDEHAWQCRTLITLNAINTRKRAPAYDGAHRVSATVLDARTCAMIAREDGIPFTSPGQSLTLRNTATDLGVIS